LDDNPQLLVIPITPHRKSAKLAKTQAPPFFYEKWAWKPMA